MGVLTACAHHARQLVKVAVNHQGQRSAVIRQEFFDLAGRFTPALVAPAGRARYLVGTHDYGLSRVLFREGSFEHDVMARAVALAEQGSGRRLEGRTFVDVGANIGTTTVPALLDFGASDAVSVEPEPGNLRYLRCNLVLNDVADRVRVVGSALSDRSGTGRLEVDVHSWGDHRVRVVEGLSDGPYRESGRDTAAVDLRRFDDLVAELPIDLSQVGLVWMDAQGHEGHILAGASGLLASGVPVVIEYWPYGLRRAGGLDRLHQLVADHFSRVVDVRESMGGNRAELPASRVAELAGRYGGEDYTDLVLLG